MNEHGHRQHNNFCSHRFDSSRIVSCLSPSILPLLLTILVYRISPLPLLSVVCSLLLSPLIFLCMQPDSFASSCSPFMLFPSRCCCCPPCFLPHICVCRTVLNNLIAPCGRYYHCYHPTYVCSQLASHGQSSLSPAQAVLLTSLF